MTEYKLQAEARETSLKPSRIRATGQIPAVLYGHQLEPKAVSLSGVEFNKVFHRAGVSSLVDVAIDGGNQVVLLKEPQHHPVTGEITHVDLFAVNMREKIKAEIPLVFENEAPALATGEATLVTNKDHLEVECLPSDLPHDIKVDLSSLAAIDDSILVKDIKLPANVEAMSDGDEIIVLVAALREEEEVPVVSEAEAVAAVEATSEKPEGDETPAA